MEYDRGDLSVTCLTSPIILAMSITLLVLLLIAEAQMLT